MRTHIATAWDFPIEGQGLENHCFLPSADFSRIHVFVLPIVGWCQPVHFQSTSMTLKVHGGDKTSLLQLRLELLSGLR